MIGMLLNAIKINAEPIRKTMALVIKMARRIWLCCISPVARCAFHHFDFHHFLLWHRDRLRNSEQNLQSRSRK